MDFLLEWLEAIFVPFLGGIKFGISLIRDLVYVAQVTGRFLGNLDSYFAWMPAEFWALMYLAFCFVVIYKIFGREG